MMYDHSETHYFDPHSIQVGVQNESTFATAAMDFQLDQKFNNAHLMQEVIVIEDEPSPVQSGSIDCNVHHQQEMNVYKEIQEPNTHYHQQEQFYDQQQIDELQHLSTDGVDLGSCSTSLPNFYLEIFGESSYNDEVVYGGENGSGSIDVLYENDPMSLNLNNLPPSQPPVRESFEALPQNYGVSCSLFGGKMDDSTKEVYQQQYGADNNEMRQFDNLVADFKREMNNNIHGVGGSRARSTNGLGIASHGNKQHITSTEKMKREKLGDQFRALSLLVPNPSKKPDRASVLASTIDYINELKGTVDYLKVLIDKKRNERNKKSRIENEAVAGDMPTSSTTNIDRDQNSFNGQVRSSWSQRKSKDAEVDVRMIDGDVTIQLIVQRPKMINLLLGVSSIFDELQLDLLHISSGCIGDYYSFWFNIKVSKTHLLYKNFIIEPS
ncbi:hypothetical protein C5167_048273 [Papaver somniferum]|uniref:BHLH domain-containing protein n=1 Tax=Papaver somniferum TaxID=3469 RepID=A0A4Y7KKT2_PAPSO|nr:hypothetical protein C5167_048273 [Papaver somniferum]